MKSTITTARLSALAASPLNVRAGAKEDDAIGALAASILAQGLIQPLAVHALAKPKGKMGVIAGRRRWLAIQKLQADGAAFDFDALPVNLIEGTDAELTEVSLAENYVRQNMRAPEIYAAFRDIQARNPAITHEQLAQHFGLELDRVGRIMRLANLHPELLALYDQGELTDVQAQAYAATEDRELQLTVWKTLEKTARYPHDKGPQAIRRDLKVGDRDLTKLLIYVGREAYEAEGGRFEQDLFADAETTGRILDEDLLRAIAGRKMFADRDRFEHLLRRNGRALGEKWGLSSLQFSWEAKPPQIVQYGQTYTDSELAIRNPKTGEDGEIILPKKGAVVGIAEVDNDGDFTVSLYYASRKEKGLEVPKGAKEKAPVTQTPEQRQRAQWGLTKDTMGAMLIVRGDMVRDQLLADANLALDFMVYSQARTFLRPVKAYYGEHFDGSAQGIETPPCQMTGQCKPPKKVSDIAATITRAPYMAKVIAEMKANAAFTDHDPVEGFLLFRNSSEELKEKALCLVAGWGIRAAEGFYGDPKFPRMIEALSSEYLGQGGQLGRWQDSVTFDEKFFALISHKKRIEILGGWGQGDRAKTLKSNESAAYCARVVNACSRLDEEDERTCGLLGISEEDRRDIANWLPDWLDPTRPAPLPAPTADEDPAPDGDELEPIDDDELEDA